MGKFILEDGTALTGKNQIGRGLFSKVYQISESEVVALTTDPAKECLALFCQNEDHLPTMERLSNIGEYQVYKMPKYEKLTKQHAAAWRDYKAVEKILKPLKLTKWECFGTCINAVEQSNLAPTIKESLTQLFEMLANYTDEIFLEVCRRNVMVDSRGNLIFTDIVGCSEKLRRVWQARTHRRVTDSNYI